jgi:hypothetical protein
MARGKHRSLEEARKKMGGLDRFAKEHPSKGDERRFDRLLRSMVSGTPEAKDQTSSEAGATG